MYKHLSYQLHFLQKGGVTLIPCYPSAGAETDIQCVAARGGRKGGGAFEGGGVPGEEMNRKSQRDRSVGRSQRTGLSEGGRKGGGAFRGRRDGAQDIAALAASVAAQGGIRHVSDRAPLRSSAALRPGAEVGRDH
eukprot:6756768-Prymnesium_polylepis.1